MARIILHSSVYNSSTERALTRTRRTSRPFSDSITVFTAMDVSVLLLTDN